MLVLFALSVRKLLAFLSSVKQKSKNKLAEIQSQLQGKAGLLCLKN
jgi:hypothetical protein